MTTKALRPWLAQAGRIGGFTKASRYPAEDLTREARRGFLRRFEDEVDPGRVLAPEERGRRANAALRAHMARLARLSALTRKKKTNGKS